MNYIGIDQSYTSTGVVVLNDAKQIVFSTIISSSQQDDIFKRAWQVSEEIINIIKQYQPNVLSIEGLAFSMTGNATRDLAGLQFSIVTKIKFILQQEISIIAPPTLKKFATGSGKAKKEDMIAALPQNVYDYFTKEKKIKKTKGLTDVTDAYFLACYLIENPLI